ncbi:TlpA family protein disulfide reductase [Ulvibacter antarcticus]|uniref:AhpC/TSA family protein n=1 Tax=Ulvibacter antarcticus TaxID=442714 RepID=A0A3L9YZX4_9FLAO|nr:TlpA disulfide reductase family protein [Ulvibacter antarcticus]RMA66176.1 AhpC/TSA family protein [Ulvibacter antarcticus]
MYKKALLTIFLFPLLASAQHTIKGTFSPAEDFKWAILYKVTPTNALYAADTQTDSIGNFTLMLDSTVTKGMYRLVYALPQDIYNFDIIYDGKEDIELTFNEEKGIRFLASEENSLLAAYQYEMQKLQIDIKNKFSKGGKELSEAFETLEKEQRAFEAAAKDKLVLNFIIANRPYIPNENVTVKSYIEKSKEHYFDHIDFTNPTLQSSNFLLETVFNYITVYVGQDDDVPIAYAQNMDQVFKKLQKGEKPFQQAFLMELWNKFVDIDRIETANYIAKKYLIPLSKSLNNTELAEQLTIFKNTSIGEKAPDFNWEDDIDGKTIPNSLYKLDTAENYIIVFWSSMCSHCLAEMPVLHSKITTLEKGKFKVIAIGLEDEPYDWQNKVFDFPEFTNILGLGKWENPIGNDYGIDATPTYFVLDKDKQIIAKPEMVEDVLKLLNTPSK